MHLEKVICITVGGRAFGSSAAVWAVLRLTHDFVLLHHLRAHVFNRVIEVRNGLLVLLSDLFDLLELSFIVGQLFAQDKVVANGVADLLIVEGHLQAEVLQELPGFVLDLAFLEQVLLVVINFELILLQEVLLMVHIVNHHLLLLEDSQIRGIVLILEVLNDLSQDEHFGTFVVEQLFKLGGALLEDLVLLLELLFKN